MLKNIIAILLTSALLAPMGLAWPEPVQFHKSYKPGDSAKYKIVLSLPGGFGEASCVITATVKSVTDGVATLNFTGEELKGPPGFPLTNANPHSLTKMSATGMPSGTTIRDEQEFIVFLCATGMVSDTKVSPGDTVKVHWTNDLKDVTFEGTGKIVSLDSDKHTLTVDWDLAMTPSYTQGAPFTSHSVYSTADFSLISAKGRLGPSGVASDLTVTKL